MEVVIHRGVGITMRDGIRLLADVYAAADGQPRPVILQRTPYDRTDTVSTVTGARLETLTAVASGFNVVVQDVRGCFESEGMFRPFAQEADDGEDTIAWVAAQPFCTGQVALVGGSYRGAAALLAASRHPEPIFAVAPLMTSAGLARAGRTGVERSSSASSPTGFSGGSPPPSSPAVHGRSEAASPTLWAALPTTRGRRSG